MKFLFICFIVLVFCSCSKSASETTGWDYNDPNNGGFQKIPYSEQETGPGLVLIEGGTFQVHLEQDSIISDQKAEVIVPSYYLDQKEVTNWAYCEYLYWTKRVFGADFPLVYVGALPDTLAWLDEVPNGENYVNWYLRHPAYKNYPVVGVSWMQANNYCEWRTDRVNELILIREGLLISDPNQRDEDHFNTEAYLAGQYEGSYSNTKKMLLDYNPAHAVGKDLGKRKVIKEDGILLPSYRLPTEVEWEYAAAAGVTLNAKSKKKLNQELTHFGQFVNPIYSKNASFNTFNIAPVDAFIPNDYGIYNLTGNISEWVSDVYVQRTKENTNEFDPFIGNAGKRPTPSLYYDYDVKLSYPVYDLTVFKYLVSALKVKHKDHTLLDSLNFSVFAAADECIAIVGEKYKADFYKEGYDVMSILIYEVFEGFQLKYEMLGMGYANTSYALPIEIKRALAKSIVDIPGNIKFKEITPFDRIVYRNNPSYIEDSVELSLKANLLRVYKGANWKDTDHWIEPSFRRGMNKYSSSVLIGFRCAMDRVGPTGLGKR